MVQSMVYTNGTKNSHYLERLLMLYSDIYGTRLEMRLLMILKKKQNHKSAMMPINTHNNATDITQPLTVLVLSRPTDSSSSKVIILQ